MAPTDTPTVAESDLHVDNAVPRNRIIEAIVAAQISRSTEKEAAKKISALEAEFLEDILQYPDEDACNGDSSVLLDLPRRDVISETVDRHILTYFKSGKADLKVGGKLLSANYFMTPIAVFIQRRTSKSIAAGRIPTKMENEMNALIPDLVQNTPCQS